MTQSLKNLRLLLGFSLLAVLLTLVMTGNLAFARKGPACFESAGPGEPGFAVLQGGNAPPCVRVRIP